MHYVLNVLCLATDYVNCPFVSFLPFPSTTHSADHLNFQALQSCHSFDVGKCRLSYGSPVMIGNGHLIVQWGLSWMNFHSIENGHICGRAQRFPWEPTHKALTMESHGLKPMEQVQLVHVWIHFCEFNNENVAAPAAWFRGMHVVS